MNTASFSSVRYASEEKFNSLTRLTDFNDQGTFEAANNALIFKGKKGTIEIYRSNITI